MIDINRGKVLHVDDEESLRFTMEMLLTEEGYEVFQAENGIEGYKMVEECQPDVILLDVNMPIMDGYELLENLQKSETMSDIPVIMNTANGKEDDIVQAFEAGAVDYITKPTRELELLARLDTHINHYRMLKFRERFLYGLNHDLKSPLAVISGMNSMLMIDQSTESISQVHNVIEKASKKMFGLINNFLDIGKLQAGAMHLNIERLDFCDCFNQELPLFTKEAENKNITLNSLKSSMIIFADPGLLKRVFSNLLSNAIKFTPKDGQIKATIEQQDKKVLFKLHDSGEGIPKNQQNDIFNMYTQVGKGRKDGEGTGLGLSIVSEVIKTHQGRIWVDPDSEKGACFCIEFPLAEEQTIPE
jgi:two-component system, sensor histidine kinase and response regulator